MLRSGGNLALRTSVFAQVPSIQQTAALALGRLANYSDDLAEAVVANEILPQLVYSLGEQNVRVARHCGYCSRPAPLCSPKVGLAWVATIILEVSTQQYGHFT